MPKAKRVTHRTPPSFPIEAFEPVARLYVDHLHEKERQRASALYKAWDAIGEHPKAQELRVALAVAYLGGAK